MWLRVYLLLLTIIFLHHALSLSALTNNQDYPLAPPYAPEEDSNNNRANNVNTNSDSNSKKNLNLLQYGGRGDGTTKNTQAFSRALQELQRNGGGTLTVPNGKFLTGPIRLISSLTLHLSAKTELIFSDIINDYKIVAPLPSYGRGRDSFGQRYQAFIYGENVSKVVITGDKGSIINGQGRKWWRNFIEKKEIHNRPHLIEFINSSNVEISSVTLKNSPYWTIHPFNSQYFHVRDVKILNPVESPNTDGIDPDSSQHVVIENTYIETGDDAIAIKSGWDCFGINFGVDSSDILINNVTLSSPNAAAVAIGSEMSGGVQDVKVLNSKFSNIKSGIRIKTSKTRGGFVRNILFRNIQMEGTEIAINIDAFYGAENPLCKTQANPLKTPNRTLPIIEKITIENVLARNVKNTHAHIFGLPYSPVKNITLKNVRLLGNQGRPVFECSNVQGTALNVVPGACHELEIHW